MRVAIFLYKVVLDIANPFRYFRFDTLRFDFLALCNQEGDE